MDIRETDKFVPGHEIQGPVLRPAWYFAAGALDCKTHSLAVAFMIVPVTGDTDFKEPVTVMISEKDIEVVVNLLRTARGLTPLEIRNGTGQA